MLYSAKTLNGFKLHSRDGVIGHAQDLYFDDEYWTVRYLVADTGGWLTGRQVLLSPYALTAVKPDAKEITVDLTKKQIEDSPSLDTHKPVSRQFETSYNGYYGWPSYWYGAASWGPMPTIVRDRDKWPKYVENAPTWDPSLRSVREVDGYHIQAADGEIGHVEDFLIDEDTWTIRYLVVNTRNWWPGKKVLVSPEWTERITWDERKVYLDLARETIKHSPEYAEGPMVDREYETRLHQYYNREGYWVDELAAR